MKIKAKNNIWTASPEKYWSAGEVLKVSEKLGKQLLTNPNFEEVKSKKKKI